VPGVREIAPAPYVPEAVGDQAVDADVIAKIRRLELIQDQDGGLALALGTGLADRLVQRLDGWFLPAQLVPAFGEYDVRQGWVGLGEVEIQDVGEFERPGQGGRKRGFAPLRIALDV
jgi:hypothetical protein